MLILSLFPGLGLLDRAFELEGFCTVRGPDVLWGGDIRAFHPPAGIFAGVIGGPPCQTFSSLANLVRANGGEPKFGNLIPEFERCVAEAHPAWFLMENVPAAPVPVVDGYAVHSFVLCNSDLPADDGLGQEQERKRRWSFGVRGEIPVVLTKWIQLAALRLPAKLSVLGDARAVPVAIGGSGKRKRTAAVLADPGSGLGPRSERVKRERQRAVKADEGTYLGAGGSRERQAPITAAHTCGHRPKGGRGERRTLAEMARLQGLPEDFLDHAPFTVQSKRQAIANGVPLPMGRALASAVRSAIASLGPAATSAREWILFADDPPAENAVQ